MTDTNSREAVAREVLAGLVEKEDHGRAVPTSLLGKSRAYYIRDAQGASVSAWLAIRAMLAFADRLTQQQSTAEAMREACAKVAERMYVKDAFRFEFGHDVAAAIRALPTTAPIEGEKA